MPGYTINLTDEADQYVRFAMEEEKMNRSKATSYLVRMGYLYRYQMLEKELKRKEENK